MDGASKIYLNGKTNYADIKQSGTTIFEGEKFQIREANINLNGLSISNTNIDRIVNSIFSRMVKFKNKRKYVEK